MKKTLLVLTLGAALVYPALAADTDTPPPEPPPGEHHHGPPGMRGLSQDERDELMAAHDAAMQANPTLEAEGKALMEKMDAYQKKVHAAMIQADSKVAPILAKMEKNRPPHDGPGGPPPGN